MRIFFLRLGVVAISTAALVALSLSPKPGYSQSDANLANLGPAQAGGRNTQTLDQRSAALADTNQPQQSKGSCG